jgi:hypothetical protein
MGIQPVNLNLRQPKAGSDPRNVRVPSIAAYFGRWLAFLQSKDIVIVQGVDVLVDSDNLLALC